MSVRPDGLIDTLRRHSERLRKLELRGKAAAETVGSTVEELKVIRGTINTAGSGSITSGSGFTITRNAAGDVTVNFTSPFASPPSVAAMSTQLHTVLDAVPGTSSVRIQTWNSANTKVDASFSFIAAGPR